MKQKIKSLLGAALAVGVLASAAPAANAVSDISGHWAEESMQSFVDQGYIEGDGTGRYLPDNAMSRAEFAAVVNRIKGFTLESSGISAYSDVSTGDWYYSDMAKALAAGYLEGSGSSMNPSASITRQEAFLVIARLIGLDMDSADTSVLCNYSDGSDTAVWAQKAVAAMVSAGYVEGSDGMLSPTAALSRAEGVTVLSRVLEVLKGTVVINGTVYSFSETPGELDGVSQIGSTGVYYKVSSGKELTGDLYGTANLTYAEFYAGDVTSTESYDAVSSATNSKYNIMSNMYISEVSDDGYQILGVKDVSVKVDAALYVEAAILKAAGKDLTAAQSEAVNILLNSDPYNAAAQYKTLNADGRYSATVFNVVETVDNAEAVLKTGSTWGDYEIDVTDPEGVSNLRNGRTDDGFTIHSGIQGIILTTSDGFKVGMEYLQSIWVQPWEVSFNVTKESTSNAHIAAWDNIEELSKLVGTTVTSITYIMHDGAYVYEFDGIYIKPAYTGNADVSAEFTDGSSDVVLSGIPSELKDVAVTISYGSGRTAVTVLSDGQVNDGKVTMSAGYNNTQPYTVNISSSNYADMVVYGPMTASQRKSLTKLVEEAAQILNTTSDEGLEEHYLEAVALLEDADADSGTAAELINDLTSHISVHK
ncbi:MAG: S-layer homology domain-containing protein [Oscillospiraceae bacterium]